MRLPYETLATGGLKALGAVHAYIAHCGLEKSLVDLVYLRASQINGCAYCIDIHMREAMSGGAKIEKLMLISAWRGAGASFTSREQAALAWAEAVTWVAGDQVSDDIFLAVQEEFADKELADLTVAISLINAYNRMAVSFRRGPAPLTFVEHS